MLFAVFATPGIDEITALVPRWYIDGDGARHVVEAVPCDQTEVLAKWLEISWQPIRRLLDEWTVNDLCEAYPHRSAARTTSCYANGPSGESSRTISTTPANSP
jgi:hypothetical protein